MRRAIVLLLFACLAGCIGIPIHARARRKPLPEGFRIPYEWVEVPAGKGTVLRGVYLKGRGGPPVLFLNGSGMGIGGSREGLEMLHDAGYGVLCCDYRGTGYSSGRWWTSRHLDDDARALWEWLRANKGEPAGVLGISIGAVAAVRLASHPHAPAAVVLDRPVDPRTVIHNWVRTYLGGRISAAVSRLLVRASCDVDLRRDLAAATAPTLVVLPEHDVLHPPKQAGRLIGGTIVTVPGGHLSSHLVEPVRWRSTILDFLDAHLGVPKGGGRSVPADIAGVVSFELSRRSVRIRLDREIAGPASILLLGLKANAMVRAENLGREFVLRLPRRQLRRLGRRLFAIRIRPFDIAKPRLTRLIETAAIDRS